MKELAAAPGGDSYADALRELFDLDPKAPEAVARADMREDEPASAPSWRDREPAVDAACAEADCLSAEPPAGPAAGAVSVQEVNAHELRGVHAETVNAQAASVRAVSAADGAAVREGDGT